MHHESLIPKVKKVNQLRADVTLDNILESADSILHEGSYKDINVRNLAEKSGYSVGTLYCYFEKAEDALILAILRKREKQFYVLMDVINQFSVDRPLRELLELIIDSSFKEFNRMNHRVFSFIFRMILKFSKNPWAFDDVSYCW